MNSAFFGQLIILIVFIPILALEGVEGKMFKPMALTFMFAMIGVMILCLTYVPMMSAWFIRTGTRHQNIMGRSVCPLVGKHLRTNFGKASQKGKMGIGFCSSVTRIGRVYVFPNGGRICSTTR